MRRPTAQTRPPWRHANRFQILAGGDRFFPAMRHAIEAAEARIALEMYLVASGSITRLFIDALCRAARRGVTVHVLLDDFGARALARDDRQRLQGAGVHFARFNPLSPYKLAWNLVRDHRKLLLIDDRLAFVGGAGLSDAFDGGQPPAWRELMIRVEGECVADWWLVFADNWHRWSHVPCHVLGPRPVGTARGRALAGATRGARGVKAAAITDIRRARERLWLSSPYFLPPWKLRRALARAVRHGCDVRLLLPGPSIDHGFVRAASRRTYGWFLRRGIRIFEYQPAFLHTKALLADQRAMIGSCNFDRWSLRWNLEANQQLDDPEVADRLRALFASEFAASREVHLAEWQRRPWHERLQEYFWGWLESNLVRASYRARVRSEVRQPGDAPGADTTHVDR